jgi:hypothetical protein
MTLPPILLEGATLRRNEYAWTPDKFSEAVRSAPGFGFACLGGQFQFRTESGVWEMNWLNADSKDRGADEEWSKYAARSCAEVLESFRRLIGSVEWDAEAAKWNGLLEELQGRKAFDYVVFVAYFVTDIEYARLWKHGGG